MSDPISYPFAIVTDHHKHKKTNNLGTASDNKDIPILVYEGVKSHETISPTSQPIIQSAANSFANSCRKLNVGRAGVQIDT